MAKLEDWQKNILDEQLAQERLYSGDTPVGDMSMIDAICAADYRARYSSEEMHRRVRWLEASYLEPNLPLSAVA